MGIFKLSNRCLEYYFEKWPKVSERMNLFKAEFIIRMTVYRESIFPIEIQLTLGRFWQKSSKARLFYKMARTSFYFDTSNIVCCH